MGYFAVIVIGIVTVWSIAALINMVFGMSKSIKGEGKNALGTNGGSIEYGDESLDIDPYGTGATDRDEAEFRYKAPGGYGGEFMEGIHGDEG